MVADYKGDYFVVGPPGTGKTTFLSNQVKKIRETFEAIGWGSRAPVVIASLTKSAAAEIAGRDLGIAKQRIGTLHAHAFRALDRPKLVQDRLADWNDEHPSLAMKGDKTPSLDDYAVEPGYSDGGSGDELLMRYDLARARMEPREVWGSFIISFADRWEAWKKREGLLDFTDLIIEAIDCMDDAPMKASVLIADEVQDFSALEWRLAQQWARAAGAGIFAGDPNQALYTWRGAHPEMFSDPSIPKDRLRVLSQSYRVPRAVHQVSQQWIQKLSGGGGVFDYKPTDNSGEVSLVTDSTWTHPEGVISEAMTEVALGRKVMIQASCSYMLNPTLKLLRERGIPFANPWRKKRGDWNPIRRGKDANTATDSVLAFLRIDAKTFEFPRSIWSISDLKAWVPHIASSQNGLIRGAKKRIAEIDVSSDEGEAPVSMEFLSTIFRAPEINELAELFLYANTPEDDPMRVELGRDPTRILLVWFASRLLERSRRSMEYIIEIARRDPKQLFNEPRLFIGTIHSFKGAEADVVFMFPDLSGRGMEQWVSTPAESDSVIRLFYVGMTRARDRLIIPRLADMKRGVSWDELVSPELHGGGLIAT